MHGSAVADQSQRDLGRGSIRLSACARNQCRRERGAEFGADIRVISVIGHLERIAIACWRCSKNIAHQQVVDLLDRARDKPTIDHVQFAWQAHHAIGIVRPFDAYAEPVAQPADGNTTVHVGAVHRRMTIEEGLHRVIA